MSLGFGHEIGNGFGFRLGFRLGLGLLVSACADPRVEPPPVPSPDRGGTLRVWHEMARDLDPILADDIYESTVCNQIYEGLVRYDDQFGVVPSLAESWTVSEDATLYRFTLREGVRFHDGSELRPEVVVASLRRALDSSLVEANVASSYLRQIEGADPEPTGGRDEVRGLRAIGDREVEIQLREPISFFLSVLAMDQTRIVPTEVGGRTALQEHPVGTGPFRFLSRETFGAYEVLWLERNPDYWAAPAHLDSLGFISAREAVAWEDRLGFLVSGFVDAADVRASDVPALEALGFHFTTAPELTVSFIGLNANQAPLDDVRIRRAVAHCVERSAFQGEEYTDVLTATGILPPGSPGYLPESRVLAFDPDEASRLVRDAGYSPDDPTPVLRLYTTGQGPTARWMGGAFRDRLRSVGVQIDIHEVGWAELDRLLLADEAPLFSLGWVADVPDADGFLYALFHSLARNNLFRFHDPETDELLEAARRIPPGPDRLDLYQAVEERILDQVPIIPLYHEMTTYAWAPGVRGMTLGPYGIAQLPFATVSIGGAPRRNPSLAEGAR